MVFHPPVVVPPSIHHGSLLPTVHVPANQLHSSSTAAAANNQSASASVSTNQTSASYANNNQSRQSLEAIVEAIRHLEGDQLFVDDSTKWQTMMLHQPADLCYTTTEHCVPASYSLFRQEKC